MMSKVLNPFRRPPLAILANRLREPRRFIQVVAGPRQTGKTTLVLQALEEWRLRAHYASADEPALKDRAWLAAQWEGARAMARESEGNGTVLALDEVQKIPDWSETVKRLWDEDTATGLELRVVVLGSAPLLMQRGLADSLAGRFEMLYVPHWSFGEMRDAFGFTLDKYLYFGAYPGAASLIDDWQRWGRYIKDSLIETTIARDVLLLSRVDKPALLRQLFELGCRYSGQILSYTKMLGQLQDAGNTTTLAHYLELLAGAGMIAGLQKHSGSSVRRRGSSPKLQVLNTALMTAQSGLSPEEAKADRDSWGRLTESCLGAHLANAAAGGSLDLSYWRAGNHEVDFVVKVGGRITAIEVKSGRREGSTSGMTAFERQFAPDRMLLVGSGGIPIEDFLTRPAHEWFAT